MKNFVIILFSLVLVACQTTEPPTGNVVDDIDQTNGGDDTVDMMTSGEIAREFMLNTPTYRHDGSDLLLVESEENGVDTYIFDFESSNTGYGDRSGKETLSSNVNHQTVVMVDDGVVTSAITDNYWNEATDSVVKEQFVTMKYEPVQCEDTPWDFWYEYNEALGETPDERPSDTELIEQFYEKTPDTRVNNVEKVQRAEVTCQSCQVCLANYYYTLEVDNGYSAEQLEEDGWDYVNPMSKAEATQVIRDWIIRTPTFRDEGRNLEPVTVYVDSRSPQIISATYSFETVNGGYGSEDLDLVPGSNYRTIEVTLESGIITDAIIDGRWDVLEQEFVR